jgi:catechol 2,3-dioxygenase-like lactoylglutathione lyase family enzyme
VKGKRIDHVGIVVDDLASARRFVTDVMGFDFDREFSIPGRVQAAFFRCGDAGVELIEITEPELRQQRLGSATARLEHVAIEVDELIGTVDRLRKLGVEVTSAEPTLTGPTRSFFTQPETTDGVTYQLFDRPGSHPAT